MRYKMVGLLAGVLSLGVVQLASAADMPVKAPVYKAPPIVMYNWTGFYVGGNAGWVGSATNNVGLTGTDTGTGGFGSELADGSTPSSFGTRYSGFIGGAQAGYNWQMGTWLAGLEADFAWSGASGSTSQVNLPQPPYPARAAITTTASNKLDYLGTFRGRLGVLVTNPLLLYVTGGLAYGKTELGVSSSCPTCAPVRNLSTVNSPTKAGWTIGAGGEWMFAPQWSVKVEYLYYDLGTNTTTPLTYTYGANTSTLTASIRENGHIVRGGINFHF